MNTTRLADTRLLVLSIVLSGGIFAVDLSLPLGVAGGVPYVIVVLASLWSPRRRDTYLSAKGSTKLHMSSNIRHILADLLIGIQHLTFRHPCPVYLSASPHNTYENRVH